MDGPARSELLTFGAPDIRDADIQEVVETLRSGWIGTGPRCCRFEKMFQEYIGCRHALALSSCTAGLELALEVLGIGPGDEVITTPLTFCATANVIVHRGARPVFVDVDRETATLDPAAVRQAITPRTRAIMPVHLYGRPCQMEALLRVAREHGLYVVEDAAHAAEAWYRGRKVGTLGDITVFSFYVTKNLTTGEGGMLVTDDPVWAEEVRMRRLHGMSQDAWKRYAADGVPTYDVLAAGHKYNMTDMHAALGIHQLARIEENWEVRDRYWRMYNEALADVEGIATPVEIADAGGHAGSRHARHLYTVLLDPNARLSRGQFMAAMRAQNIGTGIHYIALHLHTFYQRMLGYPHGSFPNAESISDRTVSLPLSPAMSEADARDVIRAVKRVMAGSRNGR